MMLYRNKKWKNTMNEKIYYSAEDIAKMLGVSMGKSYKILREMNKELAGKGFLTIAGKIPVEYFREKWYGGAKEVSAWAAVQKEIQTEHQMLWVGKMNNLIACAEEIVVREVVYVWFVKIIRC